MPLTDHVYCVAVACKITEQVEQQISIEFCFMLEHSSMRLFGWFRRLQLWATGDWQLHHDNAPSHASCLMQNFFAKHQITQVTQTPCCPYLVSCDFWHFPKTKITFGREEISGHLWDSGKYNREADGDWENCVKS